MSSTASSFHNILGREEAEEKLVADGINRSYLSRRSPLNQDYYILSYQVNGKFNHEIVDCKAMSVDFENVLREMIETNPNCEHAVIPLSSSQDVGEAGHVHHPEEAERQTVRPTIIPLRPQCYVCHLSFDNKRQRNKHLDDHKVKKCGNCGLFIPSKSYARHYKVCSKAPAPKCA